MSDTQNNECRATCNHAQPCRKTNRHPKRHDTGCCYIYTPAVVDPIAEVHRVADDLIEQAANVLGRADVSECPGWSALRSAVVRAAAASRQGAGQ